MRRALLILAAFIALAFPLAGEALTPLEVTGAGGASPTGDEAAPGQTAPAREDIPIALVGGSILMAAAYVAWKGEHLDRAAPGPRW